MTVCAFRCKALLIETSYGDISLQVPHTFIIIAIYKPALKSWKKWEISSFFFPYVRLLSISMNETSFLLALDKWRFPFRNMSCQFIGCSRFYVWGKTTQKKNWVTGKLMKGAGDWIGDFFSLSSQAVPSTSCHSRRKSVEERDSKTFLFIADRIIRKTRRAYLVPFLPSN